jgi:hypothetical protein
MEILTLPTLPLRNDWITMTYDGTAAGFKMYLNTTCILNGLVPSAFGLISALSGGSGLTFGTPDPFQQTVSTVWVSAAPLSSTDVSVFTNEFSGDMSTVEWASSITSWHLASCGTMDCKIGDVQLVGDVLYCEC